MHLWNDYEGKTLAGAFPLGKLLRTEGRSASFATEDRAGRPAVIRLTEALNDQEQMRARYRSVQAASHPNLVAIEDFGDTELEGELLIYLVCESTQESLADILSERRLSVEETREVAASIVGAVEALHENGLVHGQVEPASVLAAGEVIKLRTDCVRPAAEGAEGESARQRDVFGIADVLHRALTQQPLEDASDALALPEPYASIIRNVVRGTWRLEQVAGELRRHGRVAAPSPSPVAATSSSEAASRRPTEQGSGAGSAAGSAAVSDSSGRTVAPRESSEGVLPGRRGHTSAAGESQLPLLYAVNEEQPEAASGSLSTRKAESDESSSTRRSPLIPVMLVAGVLLLLFFAWRASTRSPASVQRTAPADAASTATAAAPGVVATPAPTRLAGPAPMPHAGPASESREFSHSGAAAGGKVWRVVAYTYNREDQAQAKVRFLEQKHAGLHPEVFSRTGGAPYLVTLGGALGEEQAASILKRARNEGLPRDVYMQNYTH